MTAIITNYTTLQAALEDHLARTDIDDENVAAMCVDLAEARLNREVRHPKRLLRNDSFTVDGQYEDAPSDMWKIVRITVPSGDVQTTLDHISADQMGEIRATSSLSGAPRYYSIVGTTSGSSPLAIEFYPSPDQAYTASVLYEQEIPALASSATNWLLDDHPDLYLAASIIEAHVWQQDWDQANQWELRYQRMLQSINKSGQREARGGTSSVRIRSF